MIYFMDFDENDGSPLEAFIAKQNLFINKRYNKIGTKIKSIQ